jgi:hypothetical protein
VAGDLAGAFRCARLDLGRTRLDTDWRLNLPCRESCIDSGNNRRMDDAYDEIILESCFAYRDRGSAYRQTRTDKTSIRVALCLGYRTGILVSGSYRSTRHCRAAGIGYLAIDSRGSRQRYRLVVMPARVAEWNVGESSWSPSRSDLVLFLARTVRIGCGVIPGNQLFMQTLLDLRNAWLSREIVILSRVCFEVI